MAENICRTNFIKEILDAHNMCRQRHSAPNLVLDDQLNEQSQQWAAKLIEMETIIHASRIPNAGENICSMQLPNPNFWPRGQSVVKEWYELKRMMQCGEEPTINLAVTFSQLVWKDTTQLGVGVARNQERMVIVCRYFPQGNVNGKYSENVLPEMH